MPSRARYLIPLFVFLIMAGFLLKGLFMDPKFIPSVLIDKPAPEFDLPLLDKPDQTLSKADMKGKVWMLNVWASWCVACRAEHPVLNELARMKVVEIYGLNYKDKRGDALNWLRNLGNPYVANIVDSTGRTGIDFGVYGVPESFIMDGEGIIRYKHTGPVTYADIKEKILPVLNELKGANQ